MLSFLVVVCVGLAGDGWTYSKFESQSTHGVAKSAARPVQASVPSSFAGRSVAKFVEHTAAVQPPAPPAKPLVAQADGSWGPDKPAATVRPTVKPEPPRPAVKAKCSSCGTACVCTDPCRCDLDDAREPPLSKAWWTLPEDPTKEGYGVIVWDKGTVVLKYEKIRPKQVFAKDRPVVYSSTPPSTYLYPTATTMPATAPVSCGRPGTGRG